MPKPRGQQRNRSRNIDVSEELAQAWKGDGDGKNEPSGKAFQIRLSRLSSKTWQGGVSGQKACQKGHCGKDDEGKFQSLPSLH